MKIKIYLFSQQPNDQVASENNNSNSVLTFNDINLFFYVKCVHFQEFLVKHVTIHLDFRLLIKKAGT